MGFPVVAVDNSTVAGDKIVLDLTQKWFLADGSLPDTDEARAKHWMIPMFIQTASGKQQASTLTELQGRIEVTANEDDWIKINASQKVPFRVNYTPEMWKRLTQAIKMNPRAIPTADRAALILDCYAVTKAKMLRPETLLSLVSVFGEERNYVVWDAISTVLFGLHKVLEGSMDIQERYERFAAALFIPRFKELGWRKQNLVGHSDNYTISR